MSLDSSILYRTLTTTATYPETVFDPSVGANVLRTDGQLTYCTIDTSTRKERDGRLYRPDTHLYTDTSIVEAMFSGFEKEQYDPFNYYENRYKELNSRIIKATEKFNK